LIPPVCHRLKTPFKAFEAAGAEAGELQRRAAAKRSRSLQSARFMRPTGQGLGGPRLLGVEAFFKAPERQAAGDYRGLVANKPLP